VSTNARGEGEWGPTAQRELPSAERGGSASAQAKRPASTWAPRASTRVRWRWLAVRSTSQACNEVVEACPRDGEELCQVLTITLGDPALTVLADRAREL